jgi:hypothetical protein
MTLLGEMGCFDSPACQLKDFKIESPCDIHPARLVCDANGYVFSL